MHSDLETVSPKPCVLTTLKQKDITDLRSELGTCSSTCRMDWWRGQAVRNRNTERFPPAMLTDMALFETTFPWTSHSPQPSFSLLFFCLIDFLSRLLHLSQMQLTIATVWTVEKRGRWIDGRIERELQKTVCANVISWVDLFSCHLF